MKYFVCEYDDRQLAVCAPDISTARSIAAPRLSCRGFEVVVYETQLIF